MKKLLRSAILGTTVGTIGLVACDAAPPPNTGASRPVAASEIAPGETLSDVAGKALAEIVRDKDAYSRAQRLATLLPTVGPELVPAVKQTLDDETLDLDGNELELLLRYWATQQPEEATRWAVENANMTFRPGAVSIAIRVWAQADPLTAVSESAPWIDEYPEISAEIQRELVRGWFERNESAELRKYIHGLEMGIPRQRALAAYVRAMIQTQGADALLQWAGSLPDSDPVYKLSVHRQAVGVVERFDHDTALRWCDKHCDGPYGKNVRSIIAGRWQRHDGPAALAWLSTEPPSHETNVAVRGTFALWARRERAAAMAWMAARTPGGPTGQREPWIQTIVPVYALLLAEDSPPSAIEWAPQVEPAEDREWVFIQAARAWRKTDAAAAEAWLLQSPLSEDAREKARAPGRKVRLMQGEPRPADAPEAGE